MPSEKVLASKKEQVAALAEKLKNVPSAVLIDYKGITVADDTKLRKEMREAGVEYAVVKNSILFQDTFVGDNVSLNCVVADKNVVIHEGVTLSGAPTLPFYLEKRKMI